MRFERAQRQWVLAGLTSYGRGCGDPRYSGVYTRVSAYIDWLRNIIGSDDLVEVEINTSSVEYTNTVPASTTKSSIFISTTSMNNTVPMNIAPYSCAFSLLFFFFIIYF